MSSSSSSTTTNNNNINNLPLPPSFSTDKNTIFNNICVKKILGKGRALVATNNISKGDLLMRINASNTNNNNSSQVVLLDSYTLAGTHRGVCLNESADLFLCKCNKIYICTNCKHLKKECNAYNQSTKNRQIELANIGKIY